MIKYGCANFCRPSNSELRSREYVTRPGENIAVYSEKWQSVGTTNIKVYGRIHTLVIITYSGLLVFDKGRSPITAEGSI